MVGDKLKDFSLIEIYNLPSVNRVSEFAEVARNLDISNLVQKYQDLVENAPRRHETGKKYFVGHERFEPNEGSNRKEEILAGALFNYCQVGNCFALPDNQELKIIDYQFPLKARQDDKGIGKIDLFGVIDQAIPSVIELKVDQDSGGKPDTPLRALLEGLAYCAMVEANQEAIKQEAEQIFGFTLEAQSPHLIVLGPEEYWNYFLNKMTAGEWSKSIIQLMDQLSNLPLPSVSLLSIIDFSWDINNQSTTGGQFHFQRPF